MTALSADTNATARNFKQAGWGEADFRTHVNGIRRSRLRLRQASAGRWSLYIAVLLLAAGGAGFAIDAGRESDWLALAIPGSIFGATLLLVGGLIWLLTRSWTKAVLRIAGDAATVRWDDYCRSDWNAFLDGEATRSTRSLLALTGIIAAIGLLFAIWGSFSEGVAAAIPGLGMIGLAAMIFGAVYAATNASLRSMRRDGGLVLIGEDGLFITGTYWPWRTFGQRLIGVAMQPAGEIALSQIVLTFRVQTKNGSTTKDVHIPVPSGRETEAELVVNRLQRDVL